MSDYDVFLSRIKRAKDFRSCVQLLDLLDAVAEDGRISPKEADELAKAIDSHADTVAA